MRATTLSLVLIWLFYLTFYTEEVSSGFFLNKMQEIFPTGSNNLYNRGRNPYPMCLAPRTSKYEAKNLRRRRPTPGCALPVDQLGNGNLVAGTSDLPNDEPLPPWLNITLATIGQNFYNKHLGIIVYSYVMTGIYFAVIPHGASSILYTGNSDTIKKYGERYTATTAQFVMWARDLFTGGEQNQENIRTSIRNIRKFHTDAAEHIAKAYKKVGYKIGLDKRFANYTFKYERFWAALDKDLKAADKLKKYRKWPKSYRSTIGKALPINQFLMGMVLWTLSGQIGGFPKTILIHDATEEELNGFNHFYAVMGYALGIDDEYNICLQPTVEKQTKYYKDILYQYFVPAMFEQNRFSKVLAEVAADCFAGNVFPFGELIKGPFASMPAKIRIEAQYIRILKDFLEIPATNIEAVASPTAKAFTVFFENVFRPASILPGFHAILTTSTNILLQVQGKKQFPHHYTSDTSIAENVFLQPNFSEK